ncbi:F0F1 ATP synthase subunit B family protein [Kordiimonas aestuarii]|uniref:F0F1 ATP synthase subunit B family protein n=1 Tax=Kordiimonas aestuarii TaxID=1005925 RepID=UPI0021D24AA4|nr:hypothetical protein [Kordiimonas aestuarii]
MAQTHTEVADHGQGGLPQFDATTFESQLVWLFLSFIVLFVIVSRMALPRVTKVLEEREERIATDLDTAERLRKEAEDVKEAYEASVTEARKKAQETILATKESIQADIAKAQAELDATLGAKAAEAEARIDAARAEALAGIDQVAGEVAAALVSKLAGIEVDSKDTTKAAKAALSGVKGA